MAPKEVAFVSGHRRNDLIGDKNDDSDDDLDINAPNASKEVALVSNKSISDKSSKDMVLVEDRTVINMSNRELSHNEISILSKGMNFAPTQSKIPTKELTTATEYGIKDLAIGEANVIRWDMLRILKKAKMSKSNILHKEKVALSELKSDDSIIILPADKGRSTVVMNKEQYIEKMSNLIMEDKTYRPLKRDLTTSLENKLGKTIKELKEQNKLNKKQATQLTPRNSLSPRLYGLPKVHKKDIPLRPIVSSINSPSYNLPGILQTY
ncbi:hypothetical protein HOLleu_01906 [Holothuria leucospilota]|uniref:Uncharacterized protein n=1 Tax=Holothuria leucospilota TaxID=206669 RepID=A0A9Q1HJH1_HOLLE|nr:hypothetical protein HOLleu_01906 [Holothuria leucospilota]